MDQPSWATASPTAPMPQQPTDQPSWTTPADQPQVYKPSEVQLADHSIPALQNAYRAMGGNPDAVDPQAWEQMQQRYANPTPSTLEGQFGSGISKFFTDLKGMIGLNDETTKMQELMGQHQTLQVNPERVDDNGNYKPTTAESAGYKSAALATGASVGALGAAVLPEVSGATTAARILSAGRTAAINASAGAASTPTEPGKGAAMAVAIGSLIPAAAAAANVTAKYGKQIAAAPGVAVQSAKQTIAENPGTAMSAATIAGAKASGLVPPGVLDVLTDIGGYNAGKTLLEKYGENFQHNLWLKTNEYGIR